MRFSAETLAKMRAAKIGRKLSAETRQKMSISRTGRKHSAETRAKMSAAKIGKKFSEETRKKMSAAQKSSKLCAETRAKINAAKIGKKLSEETRKKMSISRSGRKLSAETKAKISAAKIGKPGRKGRKHSAEAKARMSAAAVTRNTRAFAPSNHVLYFYSKLSDSLLLFDSHSEMHYAIWCERNGFKVIRDFTIPYVFGVEKKHYKIDFIVEDAKRNLLAVEIKGQHLLNFRHKQYETTLAKIAIGEKYARSRQIGWHLLTDSDVENSTGFKKRCNGHCAQFPFGSKLDDAGNLVALSKQELCFYADVTARKRPQMLAELTARLDSFLKK